MTAQAANHVIVVVSGVSIAARILSALRSAHPLGPKLVTKLYELKEVRADRAFCQHCNTKVTLSCPDGSGHRLANQQQKGVDVAVATLALIHRDQYDALVLSSGDGDVLDAVEFLSERGKRIELAVFTQGVSTDLQARADRIDWINARLSSSKAFRIGAN